MVDDPRTVPSPSVRAADLGRDLNDLALAGRGWPVMLAAVADAAGRPVRLIGVHGGVLAASDDSEAGTEPAEAAVLLAADGPVTARCVDGWEAIGMAVTAGPRRVGILLMGSPVGPAEIDLLDAARIPVAIEAVRRDAMATVRAESAGRLIDELRYGSLRAPEEVARAAERFGLPLDRPHAAAVFAYHGPNRRTWSTAVSWIEMPVRIEGERGWTVLAGDVRSEVTRIRTRLQGMVGEHVPVLGATGPVVSGVEETARSFQEAEVVLALLQRRAGQVELHHLDLGLAGLMLGVRRERLAVFVEQQLGPVLDRDDLLLTLEAWLATNGRRAAVAATLNLHRNSVGYRIANVRRLLGVDPLGPDVAVHLRAALVAREVLLATES